MARQDTFIDQLVGVHDIKVNGGSTLARRYTLNFIGGNV